MATYGIQNMQHYLRYNLKMTTAGTVFGIVSKLVVRITKVWYGWKANEFVFEIRLVLCVLQESQKLTRFLTA